MPDENSKDESGYLSPQEMREWALQESRDSAKAHELRVKEATDLATAYASGEIDAQEADKRLKQYDRRWGEALFGTSAIGNASDEQIVQEIDKARSEAAARSGGQSHPRVNRGDSRNVRS